jgi:hypothetical protein
LASETVVALAGRDERFTFAPRRAARVKGIDAPVRFVEVVPDPPLPPLRLAPRAGAGARRIRPALVVRSLAALFLIAGVALAAVLLWPGGDGSGAVPANSLVAIDPKTSKVSWHTSASESPTLVSVAGEKAWLLNRAQTISLVDVTERSLVRTFGIPATPAGIAAASDGLWVGDSANPSVLKLDTETARVVEKISTPPLEVVSAWRTREGDPFLDAGQMILTERALWFLSGHATLTRIDARRGKVEARIRHEGIPGAGPAYVAADAEAVWVYAPAGATLTRIDPETNEVVSSTELAASGPMAAGFGSVWVADSANNQVFQLAPGSVTGSTAPSVVRSVAVGGLPVGVAAGAGALWVAVADGIVAKVDPLSGDVTDRIMVGGNLGGIYADEDTVWVTVD